MPTESSRKHAPFWTTLAATAALAACGEEPAPESKPVQDAGPGLGEPLSAGEVAEISITVFPDGRGLPVGSGTAALGEVLYTNRCMRCHGFEGRDGAAHALAGAPTNGVDWTTGSAWPHATSIFDFVRRAMPPHDVKQLADDEVYSLTAYILYLNELVELEQELDQASLPEVKMPAQDYSSVKDEGGG